METVNNILKLLVSLFLIPAAILIIAVITPFAFIWKVYVSISQENRKAREILQGTTAFFIAIASSLDKFGNCAFGGFLNSALLKNKAYSFGKNHETISEVLGWAEMLQDLNRLGVLLLSALNWIEEDHCRKAMLSGLERAKKKTDFYNYSNPL